MLGASFVLLERGFFPCQVGEIYMEMTEMKQERMAAKRAANPTYRPKETEVAKCNEYCQASIDAFNQFTEFFRREVPVPLFDMLKKSEDVRTLPLEV